MEIDIDDVVAKLAYLGYTASDSDLTFLQFVIDGVEQYIKNFCNVSVVPQELYYVAVEMAAGTFLKTKVSIGDSVNDNIDLEAAGVKSITEGDVSVSYNTDGDTSIESLYLALLNKLCNRDSELVIFRKLRW